MPLLDSLQVVEIQAKMDNTTFGGTLKALRDITKAFCPESCARQVMIFFSLSNEEKFSRHLKAANGHAQKCSHLKGREAYAFLLSWVVGGEYRVAKEGSKLGMFNDNHILGRFKTKWVKFVEGKEDSQFEETKEEVVEQEEGSSDNKSKLKRDFVRIVQLLLTDAHEVRRRMESGSYGKGQDLRAVLDIVIANVTFSRARELPVLYEKMHEKSYTADLNEHLKSELLKLKVSLAKQAEGSPTRRGIFGRLDGYANQIQLLDKEVTKAVTQEGPSLDNM